MASKERIKKYQPPKTRRKTKGKKQGGSKNVRP